VALNYQKIMFFLFVEIKLE